MKDDAVSAAGADDGTPHEAGGPAQVRARRRVRLELDGLLAVHAVRAVWTALGAVPHVVQAEVTMQGAMLELDGPLDESALRDALHAAGVSLRALHDEQRRVLPVAG